MTLYSGPDSFEGLYTGKFVRAGDQIAIGEELHAPGVALNHSQLAEEDGLINALNALDSAEQDAGIVSFSSFTRRIMISDTSSTLRLPTDPEARIKTGEVLKRLSPGYEVKVDTRGIGGSRERR